MTNSTTTRAASPLSFPGWFERLSFEHSGGAESAWILGCVQDDKFARTLATAPTPDRAQNDRGGKLVIDRRLELFGSAMGEPGASCSEQCPAEELIWIIAMEDGEPNSAT